MGTGGALADSGVAEMSRRCDAEWICIDPVKETEHVAFFVENLRDAPVTLTLRIRGDGFRGRANRTITATVEGGSRENFVTLTTSDTSARYSYRYWYDWTVGRRDADHDDDYLYKLPYEPGKSFYVLQGYGSTFSHTGYEKYATDFYMPEGTAVYAARDGVVARIEESNDRGCWADGCEKFANYIVVLHGDGTTGEYFHLQRDGVLAEEGELVQAGQQIGWSGNTGHSTMPHLHFAVYRAESWGNTQSIPTRFDTAAGVMTGTRRGARYVAR